MKANEISHSQKDLDQIFNSQVRKSITMIAIHLSIHKPAKDNPPNPHPSKIENFKSEDGNGPTLSSKELVHAHEEDIQLHSQEPLSLSLVDTTIQGKHKAIPTLMILMYLMLMLTNSL